MKRYVGIFLTALLVFLMTGQCLAISRGEACIEDNGYYDTEVTDAAPGDTVYIALMKKSDEHDDYKISSKDKPDQAELRNVKVYRISDDKKVNLVSNGEIDIVAEEVEDGVEWYFAQMPIKSVDLDDYPDDGYYIVGTLRVTRKSGKTFDIDLEETLKTISFSDAESNGKLKKTAQLYRFKSNKDIELEFPNGKGHFEGKTKKAIDVFASMSHAKVSAIEKKNDDAKLTFYIGNGAEFEDIKNGKIVIQADEDDYLYEIKSGSLKNRTSWYDEDEEAFIIETDTLGSYVVSDEKLSSTYDDGDEDDDDNSDDYDYVYDSEEDEEEYVDEDEKKTETPYYDVVITNPLTGVEN